MSSKAITKRRTYLSLGSAFTESMSYIFLKTIKLMRQYYICAKNKLHNSK